MRHSAGNSLPTLALSSLAGSAGEEMDLSTLAFLTRSVLKTREEEEGKNVQAMLEEVRDPDGWNQATGNDGVQFFWHRRTRSFGLDASSLCLEEEEEEKEEEEGSSLWPHSVVDIGIGVFAMLVLLVPMHLVMCSLWLMTGLCCSATQQVWTRRTVFSSWLWQWHMQGWFCWFRSSRCVPFCHGQALMLRIMDSIHPKDCCSVGWFYWCFCTSRCVSFPVVRPLMLVGGPAGRSASCPVWTRRTVTSCRAENCRKSAVAVHQQGRLPPLRGAEADSLV